jgi:hypothetical protein
MVELNASGYGISVWIILKILHYLKLNFNLAHQFILYLVIWWSQRFLPMEKAGMNTGLQIVLLTIVAVHNNL